MVKLVDLGNNSCRWLRIALGLPRELPSTMINLYYGLYMYTPLRNHLFYLFEMVEAILLEDWYLPPSISVSRGGVNMDKAATSRISPSTKDHQRNV